ncbi:MAG: hypothetical protein R3F29_12950 [Planctomycetota bacterium]
MASTIAALRELERIKAEFGPAVAMRRRALIAQLAKAELRRVEHVVQLHEVLCFARAYPDDAATLAAVDRALDGFGARRDVRRFAARLQDSGIAGTPTWFAFYWDTARWLVQRWPAQLAIDWDEFDNRARVVPLLQQLLPYSETPGLDELDMEPGEWLATLKGPRESDAEFLVRRIDALSLAEPHKEALYDALDVPMWLEAGGGTPSRTTGRWRGARPHFQSGPLDRTREDLRAAAARAPLAVRRMTGAAAQELLDLAKTSMVTRSRDLDAFCNADLQDVRVVDCGEGLSFALIGLRPERRLVLESSYGMLTLKNGLPIGYVLISALFGSAAIAYNVFDTFRGGEAAKVLGRVIATARHVFGVDSVSIDPYQLGNGNDEGLRSGAWWFYQKLGFRPDEPEVVRLMNRELRRMQKDPGYRSDLDTMRELVQCHVHLHLGRARDDVLGKIGLGAIGLRISALLAKRCGADREEGLDRCEAEARAALGDGPGRGWTAGERLWWRRWSPLLCAIADLARWTAAEKRAVVAVVRQKGGRHESDFVRAFDGHVRLRRAITRLAR